MRDRVDCKMTDKSCGGDQHRMRWKQGGDSAADNCMRAQYHFIHSSPFWPQAAAALVKLMQAATRLAVKHQEVIELANANEQLNIVGNSTRLVSKSLALERFRNKP